MNVFESFSLWMCTLLSRVLDVSQTHPVEVDRGDQMFVHEPFAQSTANAAPHAILN